MHSGRTIFRECRRRPLISDITAGKRAARDTPGLQRGDDRRRDHESDRNFSSFSDASHRSVSKTLGFTTLFHHHHSTAHLPPPCSTLSSAALLSVVPSSCQPHAHTSRPPRPDIFLDPRICPPKRVSHHGNRPLAALTAYGLTSLVFRFHLHAISTLRRSHLEPQPTTFESRQDRRRI